MLASAGHFPTTMFKTGVPPGRRYIQHGSTDVWLAGNEGKDPYTGTYVIPNGLVVSIFWSISSKVSVRCQLSHFNHLP